VAYHNVLAEDREDFLPVPPSLPCCFPLINLLQPKKPVSVSINI
uniref:Uncharacterized protein n=1 Tax=Anopheles minimus TaxID=112268 RepID=A0A182WNF4_9DIPT